MNALVVRTSVTKCPPTAEISKEDTSAFARKATNTYKAIISIVNVSNNRQVSYLAVPCKSNANEFRRILELFGAFQQK